MQTVEQTVATTRHPLDPLTGDEVQAASSILKKERGLDADYRFVYVMLNEPSKKEVLAFKPGNGVQVDREAFIVLRDRSSADGRVVKLGLTEEAEARLAASVGEHGDERRLLIELVSSPELAPS